MKTRPANGDSASDHYSAPRLRWLCIVVVGCMLVGLLGLLRNSSRRQGAASSGDKARTQEATADSSGIQHGRHLQTRLKPAAPPTSTAEEIVARKLVQFGKNRHDLVYAIARRFNVSVPDDVERFFAAVEGGRWEEIDAAHNALLAPGQGFNQPRSADLHQIWRGIQETWGIAREAHTWPAQELLDYGEAVLGSLRPGAIYVGGTDPGCFIPTFLNETSESEPRITLTQNALADSTYLDYLNFRYADRLATLTQDDSKRVFDEYTIDARKRFEHDQQFPDDSRQVLEGENIKIVDGKVEVTGKVVVMAINEKLFQLLMEKNANASFAIEQSFAFKSTYADASPVGPIMELRVQDEQNALTRERAAQSVDFWRTTAQQLSSRPDATDSLYPRLAYAKMAAEQAGLFLNRGYAAEAEQTLRLANEFGPGSPEAFFRLVNLLQNQGRIDDALAVAEATYRNLPSSERLQAVYGENQTPAEPMRNAIEELRRLQKSTGERP